MEVVECLWVGADLAYRVVLSVAWIQDKLVKHEGSKDKEQSQGNSDFVCFLHQSIPCHNLAITLARSYVPKFLSCVWQD